MDEALELLNRVQALVVQERTSVEKAREEAEKEFAEARKSLENERSQLRMESRFSRLQMAAHSERVKLNVGGTIYETTLSTLRKEESFLSALFSGRYEVARDEKDGSVFIDRDGQIFKHILNYLRRGRLLISETDSALAAELLDEARFFQIASLIELLQPKKVSIPFLESGAGLFHWLGTSGLTRNDWTNPVALGMVRIRSSRTMSGSAEGVVAKQAVAGGICKDARGQWIEVDIGKDRLFALTHYSLRHGQCCRMGNWMLQASPNREEWTTLYTHVDEFWEGALKSWQLPKTEARKYFRWFRIVGNGRDAESASCFCMHFSCLELYGDLRISKRKERKVNKDEKIVL